MTEAAEQRLIGFSVGGAGAALPLGIVREVTDRPRIVRVPGSHPFVSGVALYAGVALPVYDLRRFEALWSDQRTAVPGDRQAYAGHLIVCDWGEVALGLLGDSVDLVPGMSTDPGGDENEDMQCALSGAFVKRVLRLNGEAIALLDADRLFASLRVPAARPRGRRGAGEDDSLGG